MILEFFFGTAGGAVGGSAGGPIGTAIGAIAGLLGSIFFPKPSTPARPPVPLDPHTGMPMRTDPNSGLEQRVVDNIWNINKPEGLNTTGMSTDQYTDPVTKLPFWAANRIRDAVGLGAGEAFPKWLIDVMNDPLWWIQYSDIFRNVWGQSTADQYPGGYKPPEAETPNAGTTTEYPDGKPPDSIDPVTGEPTWTTNTADTSGLDPAVAGAIGTGSAAAIIAAMLGSGKPPAQPGVGSTMPGVYQVGDGHWVVDVYGNPVQVNTDGTPIQPPVDMGNPTFSTTVTTTPYPEPGETPPPPPPPPVQPPLPEPPPGTKPGETPPGTTPGATPGATTPGEIPKPEIPGLPSGGAKGGGIGIPPAYPVLNGFPALMSLFGLPVPETLTKGHK